MRAEILLLTVFAALHAGIRPTPLLSQNLLSLLEHDSTASIRLLIAVEGGETYGFEPLDLEGLAARWEKGKQHFREKFKRERAERANLPVQELPPVPDFNAPDADW